MEGFKMNVIEVKHLTKDYGNQHGIFDIHFNVQEGEIFGYVGTNGSGKTTTIRHLMGFLKPDNGSVTILGMDAVTQACEIKKYIGYVPGEIAFPDLSTGTEFLHTQAELLHLKDMSYANYLIQKLQLDTSAKLKRMSKGMKQKTAIVAALMADPKIIIMDEPTTGLDPLMRLAFIDIILEEKKKGKTIFMSSHIFEEIESTCDKVALIKNGHLVSVADMNQIRNHNIKTYQIGFQLKKDYQAFSKLDYSITKKDSSSLQLTIQIENEKINQLFSDLAQFTIKNINEIKYDLETYFDSLFFKEEK